VLGERTGLNRVRLCPAGSRGQRERRPRAQTRLARSRHRERVQRPRRHGARIQGARKRNCYGAHRLPAGRTAAQGRGAGVLPVRQPNYSKIDNCYCPRHQPQIEKTANSSRGKNAKSTHVAKQSKHSFLKGGVTRLKEGMACEGLSGCRARRCRHTAFLCLFYLLFFSYAQYNPPRHSKGVVRGRMFW
jgi:hypothetical protein